MKTKLLLSLIILISSTSIYAQCSRSGTFIPDSPDTTAYPISGNANVTIENNGSLTVNFEDDFVSVQGFKLAVYLSETPSIDTDPLSNPNPTTFIRVDQDGDLLDNDHNSDASGHDGHAMSGAKTFNQNLTGVNINDYKYVILQCIQFHVPWGYADLGAQSTGCSLGVSQQNLVSKISFYPNPVSNQITINNTEQLDIKITISDLLGKTVFRANTSKSRNQEIDLKSLKRGVYLLQINSNGNTITKKLIKQ